MRHLHHVINRAALGFPGHEEPGTGPRRHVEAAAHRRGGGGVGAESSDGAGCPEGASQNPPHLASLTIMPCRPSGSLDTEKWAQKVVHSQKPTRLESLPQGLIRPLATSPGAFKIMRNPGLPLCTGSFVPPVPRAAIRIPHNFGCSRRFGSAGQGPVGPLSRGPFLSPCGRESRRFEFWSVPTFWDHFSESGLPDGLQGIIVREARWGGILGGPFGAPRSV